MGSILLLKGLLEGLGIAFLRSHPSVVTISPHLPTGKISQQRTVRFGTQQLPRPMQKTPTRETPQSLVASVLIY